MENKPTERILLVDDEPNVLFMFSEYLKRWGYEVSNAASGGEVTKAIGKQMPDLILLDISLPGISGIEVCKQLKEDPKTQDITIILFSVRRDLQSKIKGIEAGAEDYLLKDAEVEEVRARIRSQINFKHARDFLKKTNAELDATNKWLRNDLKFKEKISRFSRNINTYLNLDNLFSVVKEMLEDLFYAEVYTFFILENNQLRLIAHNHKEWGEDHQAYVITDNKGIMWDTVHNKSITVIEEYSKSKYSEGKLKKYENDSAVCVPLIADQRVIGVLNLNNLRRENLNKRNINNIQNVAAHLALAFNNTLLHSKIEDLTNRDELTGLHNRRYLNDVLKNQIALFKRNAVIFSILMIDLDHFKNINDTYGHPAGDRVLKETALLFHSHLRESDVICRFGGEEFVMFLPQTKVSEAKILAERLRESLEKKTITINDSKEIKITASIGISEFEKKDTEESLLEKVDKCLYQAKSSGRNQCVVG